MPHAHSADAQAIERLYQVFVPNPAIRVLLQRIARVRADANTQLLVPEYA